MTPPTPHPAHDDLVHFGRGLLPADQRQAVEAHVATCDECTAHLTVLDPDSLAQLLRQAPQLAACPNSTPLPPALEGLTSPFSNLPSSAEGTPGVDGPSAIPEPLREHPRYRVLRLLGRGGMGNVYLAEHRHMGRAVALKVIDPSILDNPAAVRRFRQEVKAAAQLSHPNIVQAYDAEEAGGLHFLVLEYVQGQQLAAYVAESGPLPYPEACEYARQAALALQYAHGAGLVHRDVKPHNLMVTPDRRIKVLDFGLARVLARSGAVGVSATQAGSLMGTPDYVAPEQARDAGTVDGRADVYSLGCTLYHLLTGRPPFPGGTAIEKVARHLTEQVPMLDAARLGLPPGLVEVVARMTAPDPGLRYQTASEAAAALAPFASPGSTPREAVCATAPLASAAVECEAAIRPDVTGSAPSPGGPGRMRWGWVAAAAGLLGFVALAAGVVVYRVQTDKGEIVIRTVDDDVEVLVKQGGKIVTIYDPKAKQTLILRSGTYEFELKGKPTGLKLDLEKATLTRGDVKIATIERVTQKIDPVTKGRVTDKKEEWAVAPLPDKVGLVREIPIRLQGALVPEFSRDGRLVAISVGNPDWWVGSYRIMEVATGRLVQEVGLPDERIIGGQFMRDGEEFLTCTEASRTSYFFRLWDLRTGEQRKLDRIPNLGNWPAFDAPSPDGRLLPYRTDTSPSGTWVLDLQTGQVVAEYRTIQYSKCIQLSPDSHWAVTSETWGGEGNEPHKAGRLHIEDLTKKLPARTISLPRAVSVLFVGNPPGQAAVFTVLPGKDAGIEYWDLEAAKPVGSVPLGLSERNNASFQASRDGRRAFWWTKDGKVRFVDLPTGKEVHALTFPKDGRRLLLSADGRVFAIDTGNAVQLYRLPDPRARCSR